MSYDIASTTTKKRDPENVGVVVGIFLLCALELEICLGCIYPPPPLPINVAKKPLPGEGSMSLNGHFALNRPIFKVVGYL